MAAEETSTELLRATQARLEAELGARVDVEAGLAELFLKLGPPPTDGDVHRIGIYDDYTGPDAEPDPYAIGDGMYYDGGLYGPDGGPDNPPTDDTEK